MDLHIRVFPVQLFRRLAVSGLAIKYRIRDILLRKRMLRDRPFESKKEKYTARASAGRSVFHTIQQRLEDPMLADQLRERIFAQRRPGCAPDLRPHRREKPAQSEACGKADQSATRIA